MRKVCTTTAGDSTCCIAAQQNMLNQAVRVTMRNGRVRCGECTVIQKRNGSPGFRFRWRKSNLCGIGPSGCAALAGISGTMANMGISGQLMSALGQPTAATLSLPTR
jgi:hypothetical protein